MGNTHGIRRFLIEDDPNPPNRRLQPVFQVGTMENTHIVSWYMRPVEVIRDLQELCPNFPDIDGLNQADIYIIRAATDSNGNKLTNQYRSYPIEITSVHNPIAWEWCTVNVAYTDGTGITLDNVNIVRIFWLPPGRTSGC